MKKIRLARFSEILFVFSFLFCTPGCKTTGCFSGTASLVVMIVDENGKGIRDFQLVLSNFNRSEKGITNTNGFCVFENIPSGAYEVSGKKEGYVLLNSGKINFVDKTDVFCFSAPSANYVFTQSEYLYECGDYSQALELLDSLFCEKKSELNATVCFFKAYAYAAINDSKNMERELKKMKSASKKASEKYSVAVKTLSQKE